jgi:hypothetical protein
MARARQCFVCFSKQRWNNQRALNSFTLHLTAPVHFLMTAVRYQPVILFIPSVRLVLGNLIDTLQDFRTFPGVRHRLWADRLTGRQA